MPEGWLAHPLSGRVERVRARFLAPGDQARVQVRPRSNTLTESRNVVQVLDLPVTFEKDDQLWESPPQFPRSGGRNAAVRDT